MRNQENFGEEKGIKKIFKPQLYKSLFCELKYSYLVWRWFAILGASETSLFNGLISKYTYCGKISGQIFYCGIIRWLLETFIALGDSLDFEIAICCTNFALCVFVLKDNSGQI